jgi:hypothetical protein
VGFEVHRHGQVSSAVVRVIEYRYLAAASMLAGNLYCVFYSFGTGIKKR